MLSSADIHDFYYISGLRKTHTHTNLKACRCNLKQNKHNLVRHLWLPTSSCLSSCLHSSHTFNISKGQGNIMNSPQKGGKKGEKGNRK